MSPIAVRLDIRLLKRSLMWEDAEGMHADLIFVHNENGLDDQGNTHVIMQVPQAKQRRAGAQQIVVGAGRIIYKEFKLPPEPQKREEAKEYAQWKVGEPLPFES